MGQALADSLGSPEPPMTIEESTRQVLQQVSLLYALCFNDVGSNTEKIDGLSDETSGKFSSFDGKELPW